MFSLCNIVSDILYSVIVCVDFLGINMVSALFSLENWVLQSTKML
jgi:hypothetical protein